MADRIEIYRDADKRFKRWRWRRRAGNGQIVSDPGQGFTRRWSAVRSARREAPGVEIVLLNG